LEEYFNANYKKLPFSDFKDTNDYLIQKINFGLKEIQKFTMLENSHFGQLLENFILSSERAILLAGENKMISATIAK
jgi:hypothetical protein